MKIIKNLFCFMILGCSASIYTINNTIILFLDKYPKIKIPKNKETKESLSKKLKQPDFVYKKKWLQKRLSSGAEGIMAMYLGNVSLSSKDGQLTFPRGHQKPIVNLLISQGIQPAYILAPATIYNWMIDKNKPAKMYQFLFDKDQETKLYYIEATEVPLPKDSMIPLETIIIIADPKSIFVPLGATITYDSANLVLPNIYIKKEFNYSYNALYTNSIKQYFDSVQSKYKQEELAIAKITTTRGTDY